MNEQKLIEDLKAGNNTWELQSNKIHDLFSTAKIKRSKILIRRKIASTIVGCFLVGFLLTINKPVEETPNTFYQEMAENLDSLNENILVDIYRIEDEYNLSF
jgi:hypothetical protein